MKYIRTKDGRMVKVRLIGISCSANYLKTYWSEQGEPFMEEKKDFMVADTIGELCDEFRYGNHKRCYHDVKHDIWFDFESDRKLSKEEILVIKGAIWTEWGLKYVAKMNEKGELELL